VPQNALISVTGERFCYSVVILFNYINGICINARPDVMYFFSGVSLIQFPAFPDLFSTACRLLFSGYWGLFTGLGGIKEQGCEADYSSPSSAKV
jgi:hypothetical protein